MLGLLGFFSFFHDREEVLVVQYKCCGFPPVPSILVFIFLFNPMNKHIYRKYTYGIFILNFASN